MGTKPKEWQWNTPADKARVSAGSIGGFVAYGALLCLAFNPALVVLTGLLAYREYKKTPQFDTSEARIKVYMAAAVRTGALEIIPSKNRIHGIVQKVSGLIGIETPQIYKRDERARLMEQLESMPAPLRHRYYEKMEQQLRVGYMAIPNTNTLAVTPEALKNNASDKELTFIMAHELSHLKNDNLLPIHKVDEFIDMSKKVFRPALVVGIALSIFLPHVAAFILTTSALKAIGAYTVGKILCKIGNNYAKRTVERRADKNALYVTRDFNTAARALELANDEPEVTRKSYLKELFIDHPSHVRRIQSMKKAWKKAITYPALVPGGKMNDNDPDEPAFLKDMKLRA